VKPAGISVTKKGNISKTKLMSLKQTENTRTYETYIEE
jgi:hypothetical protein